MKSIGQRPDFSIARGDSPSHSLFRSFTVPMFQCSNHQGLPFPFGAVAVQFLRGIPQSCCPRRRPTGSCACCAAATAPTPRRARRGCRRCWASAARPSRFARRSRACRRRSHEGTNRTRATHGHIDGEIMGYSNTNHIQNFWG